MTYSGWSKRVGSGFPPGHPAGNDNFVSAGGVLSGRGQGNGGSLAARLRWRRPTRGVVSGAGPAISAVHVTTVMIAVEHSQASVDMVRTARRLFGDATRYFVVNVEQGQYSKMSWAYVSPVTMPEVWYPPGWTGATAKAPATATERAQQCAAEIADEASLVDATALGAVGDPATAIIRAAHDHHADVVVIGSHAHGWLSHRSAGSVEVEILRDADFAVLVVN